VKVQQLTAENEDDDAETDNPVSEACRQETAKLHAGDPENVRLWRMFMPWCLAEIDKIYQRLDVHFDHTHGESFYNPMLQNVVRSLQERGIAQESKGAIAVFLNENAPPALIQKRDCAFTYTTSDLATIQYRVDHWKPDAMLYVVDFRQGLHFSNLFAIARRWGYDQVALEHVSFGSVLGEDGKPIKTREGGAVELSELLD
jgi:arginyl-tRNA synthetase